MKTDEITTADALAWFEMRRKAITMSGACRMYDKAIAALHAQAEAETQGPCSMCVYGGKHLDAPPCTTCPARPKEAEKNEPLTLEELRKEEGNIVYCIPLNDWVKVTKVGLLFFETSDYCGWIDIIENYGKTFLAYRHKPENGRN